jgi:hypothetical protein
MEEDNERVWAATGDTKLMFLDAKVEEDNVFYLLTGAYTHWTIISDHHNVIDHQLLPLMHVVIGGQQLEGRSRAEAGLPG